MQEALRKNPNKSPKNWQDSIRLGKVIASDPEAKTVDITMVNGSGVHYNVPVLTSFASSSSGLSHLPKPHNPKTEDEDGYDTPVGYDKRDIYAIIGFVEGIGTIPVVLGFMYPDENQLSFPDSVGTNQKLDRHEGDRYHRITGDTVSENGGEDVSSEEEIRYPDHSYFKVVKKGGTRNLTDLSDQNRDAEKTPFQLKKEDRKGYYFQHTTGSRVFMGHDGEIKVSHRSGTWISIGPDIDDIAKATAGGKTIDSANDPPASGDESTAQVHIGHSSGTTITVDASGKVTIVSTHAEIKSGNIDLGTSTLYKLLDERTHTYMGTLVSSLNTWLNEHDHNHDDPAGTTTTPNQTASLASPPDISLAATSETMAS